MANSLNTSTISIITIVRFLRHFQNILCESSVPNEKKYITAKKVESRTMSNYIGISAFVTYFSEFKLSLVAENKYIINAKAV